MNLYVRSIFCLLGQLALLPCQSGVPFYQNDTATEKYSKGDIIHTIYLIGDAGKLDVSKPSGIEILQQHLTKADTNSTVIFLGDNIYDSGLPAETSSEYLQAEKNLKLQLSILNDYGGNVVFIPGNHDWNYSGGEGNKRVQRQELYIENSLKKGNTFLPDNACAGPIASELDSDIVLLAIDTQWYLHKKTRSGKKEGCLVDNEKEFVEELEKTLVRYKGKKIIIAGHHPIFTNGPHGGFFTLKDHLFPLTAISNKLWIPLPIIGSLYPVLRKFGINRQDVNHKKQKKFKSEVLPLLKKYDDLIYAAGHEHSLQHFKKDNQHFIVSGAGCKTSHVVKDNDASFTHSQQGFFKVIYLSSGEIIIEAWATNQNRYNSGDLIYRTKI